MHFSFKLPKLPSGLSILRLSPVSQWLDYFFSSYGNVCSFEKPFNNP